MYHSRPVFILAQLGVILFYCWNNSGTLQFGTILWAGLTVLIVAVTDGLAATPPNDYGLRNAVKKRVN